MTESGEGSLDSTATSLDTLNPGESSGAPGVDPSSAAPGKSSEKPGGATSSTTTGTPEGEDSSPTSTVTTAEGSSPDGVVSSDPGSSTSTDSSDASSKSKDQPGDCDCAPHADKIFLVDHHNVAWRFNPRQGDFRFTKLAKIDCQNVGTAGPNRRIAQVGLDHRSRLWVMTSDRGELLVVDTLNANACQNSMRAPGADQVGVGSITFTRDLEQRRCDRLYLHSLQASSQAPGALATWLPRTKTGSFVANTRYPEAYLSGSADGRLFAVAEKPRKLLELDPKTGKRLRALADIPSSLGLTYSYTQWGGEFYFFVPKILGVDSFLTSVWKLSFNTAGPHWEKLPVSVPTFFVTAAASVCADKN